MKFRPPNRVEYLTVFTDVCNLPGTSLRPEDATYQGRRWVDFTVPTAWLIDNLGVKREMDISVKLALFEIDKERVLIDAINDGVVSYGW